MPTDIDSTADMLDRSFRDLVAAVDGEIAASGAVDRVSAAVISCMPVGDRWLRPRRFAAAAAILLAAGLGGAVERSFPPPADTAGAAAVPMPVLLVPDAVAEP